jgi:DNA processing protein
VLALPGRVDHPMSAGCHRLIKEGAQLVERPDEVLAELGVAAAPSAPGRARAEDELGLAIVAALTGETLTADEVCVRTGRPLAEVLTRLVELELSGAVARGPGGLFRLDPG